MLKLLFKKGIPNVITYHLTDPMINTIALLFERVVKERKLVPDSQTRVNYRANYFLSKQFKRLERYSKHGEWGKFDFLARKLLTSYSFRIQAYNEVMKDWLKINGSTVKHHLRFIGNLCHGKRTDLDYKRVWIDKKPQDFARPLGVPSLEWRVYLRMITNLGEIYLKGTNKYSNFQHGGRPGKGVMTALMDMVENLRKYSRVYEFDLKGFFDHVSKDAVKEFFKGTFLSDLYYSILKVKPSAYKLPPEEVSYAKRIAYNQKPGVTQHRWDLVGKDLTDSELFDVMNNPGYTPPRFREVPDEPPELLDVKVRLKLTNGLISDAFWFGEWKKDWDDGHRPSTFTPNDIQEIIVVEEKYKAKKRPKWEEESEDWMKDLNMPDQGIPQGTSFGPMIASTIAAYHLRSIRNLLMYVDDGMVFLNPTDEDPKERISEALRPIRVELALEKSKITTRDELLKKGLKFLGTRTFVRGLTTKIISMRSETRKGIIKDLPTPNKENYLKVLKEMYKAGMLTISKSRVLEWHLRHSEAPLRKLLDGDALSISMKWGFFGNLLAYSYSPEVDMIAMKNKIAEGAQMAERAIMQNPSSIGFKIMEREVHKYVNTKGEVCEASPNLFNLSSIGCEILLLAGKEGIRRAESRKKLRKHSLDKDLKKVSYAIDFK